MVEEFSTIMTINWIRDPIYGHMRRDRYDSPLARRIYAPLWVENSELHTAIEEYPRPVDLCMGHDGKIRINWTTLRSLAPREAVLSADELHDKCAIDTVRVRLKLDATC